MVVLAHDKIFGSGTYSMRGDSLLRYVGKGPANIVHYKIRPSRGGKAVKVPGVGMVFQNALVDPFLPESYQEPFHPGGNSVCFCIQHAHLMGADPIYLVGFTLERGGYAFGERKNPVLRSYPHPPYALPQIMNWLRFYEKRYPGRVRLDPSFTGPIYDVFKVDETLGQAGDEAQDEPEPAAGSLPGGDRADPDGGDVHGVE